MNWKKFKETVEKQSLKDSDTIDYIDVDVMYESKPTPKIIVSDGREPRSKAVWSKS